MVNNKNKFYIKIGNIALALLISFQVKSQCLSGNYTIGGTSPDYVTFANAINAVNLNGICGNIVFNVRPGTYNEFVNIPNIVTSSTNTILFQSENGDSSSVVLQYDSLHTLTIDANYISFNKMTINSANSNGSILLNSNSKNVQITNCSLNCSNCFTSIGILRINDADSILIQNSNINSNSKGIEIFAIGTSRMNDIRLSNNIINTPNGNAISIKDVNNFIITSNKVLNSYIAIHSGYCGGSNLINNNNLIADFFGIYCFDYTPSTSELRINNNFVSIISSVDPSGISVTDIPIVEIIHNTVKIGSNEFYKASLEISYFGNYTVLNNIFINEGNGSTFFIQGGGGVYNINYNLYFNSGPYIGHDNFFGGNISSISAYNLLTGRESNGLQLNPLLVSSSDLHITTTSPARNAAISSYVLDDFDFQTRDLMPDIGADEYISEIGIESDLTLSNDELIIYPNPTNGVLNIISKESDIIEKVTIYSELGELIGTHYVDNKSINLRNLSNGVYYLQIGNFTEKFVIVK